MKNCFFSSMKIWYDCDRSVIIQEYLYRYYNSALSVYLCMKFIQGEVSHPRCKGLLTVSDCDCYQMGVTVFYETVHIEWWNLFKRNHLLSMDPKSLVYNFQIHNCSFTHKYDCHIYKCNCDISIYFTHKLCCGWCSYYNGKVRCDKRHSGLHVGKYFLLVFHQINGLYK